MPVKPPRTGASRDVLLESLVGEFGRLGTSLHAAPLGRPGFGLPHFKIFFIVSRHENGMPVKELAAMLGVTPSAVSQLVDPLVTRGILERKKDDTDRRSIRIRAAAKRNAEYERFATAFLDSARRMFSPLSDRELKTLTALFTKINHATRRVRA